MNGDCIAEETSGRTVTVLYKMEQGMESKTFGQLFPGLDEISLYHSKE